MILSVIIGLSRITDHMHHWYDVLAGFILGGFMAIYIVSHIPLGGLPYYNWWECLLELWKDPLRGTKILFLWAWLKFFSPLRGTNSKATHWHSLLLAQYQKKVLWKLLLWTFWDWKPQEVAKCTPLKPLKHVASIPLLLYDDFSRPEIILQGQTSLTFSCIYVLPVWVCMCVELGKEFCSPGKLFFKTSLLFWLHGPVKHTKSLVRNSGSWIQWDVKQKKTFLLIMMFDLKAQPASISSAICGLRRIIIVFSFFQTNKMEMEMENFLVKEISCSTFLVPC